MPSVAFSMPATEHHFYRMLVKSNSNWWSHLTYIIVLKQTADDTDIQGSKRGKSILNTPVINMCMLICPLALP